MICFTLRFLDLWPQKPDLAQQLLKKCKQGTEKCKSGPGLRKSGNLCNNSKGTPSIKVFSKCEALFNPQKNPMR